MDLSQALAMAEIYSPSATEIFVIDAETRNINVPDGEELFGVKGDKDVERKFFQCPRIVGDNIDLSLHRIYISYAFVQSSGSTAFPDISDGRYHCEDMTVDGDYIRFSWLLSENVFLKDGYIAFKVMAMCSDGENLKTKWNTTPAYGAILTTVPDGDDIVELYPDVINQLYDRLEALEAGGVDDEKISQVVTDYMEEKFNLSQLEDDDTKYTTEVKIDPETGKLYVPSITFSTTENLAGGLTATIG